MPAAIAGVWVIEWLHDRYGSELDDIVLTMLAIALIVVGVVVLVRALFMSRAVNGERESFELTRRHKVAAVAIGASTGFVIGLTSAGSGTLIAVFLIAYYRLVPAQGGGHRRLPRRGPAVGRRDRAHRGRQRRLRAGRRDPDGLDPGRVDRQPPERASCRAGSCGPRSER